jgi:hypothetical protein
MKILKLADLKNISTDEIKKLLVDDYGADKKELDKLELLIAYESVGAYGCDSSAFYLFRRGTKYFSVRASHCSCYGFEGQFQLESEPIELLRNGKFGDYLYMGGYDSHADNNKTDILNYCNKL